MLVHTCMHTLSYRTTPIHYITRHCFRLHDIIAHYIVHAVLDCALCHSEHRLQKDHLGKLYSEFNMNYAQALLCIMQEDD